LFERAEESYNSIVISVAEGLHCQTLRLNKKMRCKSSRCRRCKCRGSLSLVKASHWDYFLRRQTGCCLRHKPEDLQRYGITVMIFWSLQNLEQCRKTAEVFDRRSLFRRSNYAGTQWICTDQGRKTADWTAEIFGIRGIADHGEGFQAHSCGRDPQKHSASQWQINKK